LNDCYTIVERLLYDF